MKIPAKAFVTVLGLAVFCFGIPAFAQHTVTLTGVNGQHSAGYLASSTSGPEQVDTGLYYATVDGVANTGIICDDFNHNESVGQTWNATAVNASTLGSNLGQTEFGSTIGLVGYAEVADLVSEMFTLNNGPGTFDHLSITGTDLSEAIWDITTKGGISGISNNAKALVSYVKGLFVGKNATTEAQNYLSGLTNLWILTPTKEGYGAPQEVWMEKSMPEGGSALMYLLLGGFTCFGAMFFKNRSQVRNRETA